MKTRTLLASLAMAAGLVAGGAALVPAFAQNAPVAAPMSEAAWLSIPQIHDKLTAAGYRDIRSVERERNRYEVKATNAEGQRVELYVDPQSGEVMKTERKRADRDDEDRERGAKDRRD
ncbi:PepSY domain-containing protein [Denitromonas ohlonensis]|uniref:PepSY domain-containing protein n=2 Tax=Denitromonas TaxID=139331 RepID=A0A558ENS9_9RHOO|nr:PepSY domain-containing protein [Denitromonas ohlonensis]TVO67038.1 PepSY domain-containing protein [Denitromonas ohlonensis]TVO79098.1 PepSY domain-containing protein [Denitromonas ohlonensis]TVT50778.1 MAG: PepSY domain-containing protein [Denitromonas halophila]TVT74728.1 MAG: PepSY domain-containing protein [Denitromonas halophila]